MDKPIGTFKCLACLSFWDGSELYQDPRITAITWTCGNLGGFSERWSGIRGCYVLGREKWQSLAT